MEMLLASLLGVLPSLIWLAFFLKEDVHPEPKKMILAVYLWGGLSSIAALLLEQFSKPFADGFFVNLPGILSFNITPFVLFAIIEEVCKFFFVFMIIYKSKHFDEPIDAMVYTATGALGFATAENIFIMLSNGMSGAFSLVVMRFLGATLLHALASTAAGYYWATGRKHNMEARAIFVGLVMASIIHAIFNILVWQFGDFLIYPIAFLIIVAFFILYDFEQLREES